MLVGREGGQEDEKKMITFELPIIPTAQQRARHTRTGRAYKSSTQEENEQALEAMLMPYRPDWPLKGPVRLVFTAYMPIPASASKKNREAMLEGKIGHTKKPDVDNLAKQLLDAMSRLWFWEDDRQVVELIARKRYGESPRWVVEVSGDV